VAPEIPVHVIVLFPAEYVPVEGLVIVGVSGTVQKVAALQKQALLLTVNRIV
jgi:hypothetical protein